MRRLLAAAFLVTGQLCLGQTGSTAIQQAVTGSGMSGNTATSRTLNSQMLIIDERPALAMASTEYLVTPGDVYQLSYQKTGSTVSLSVFVESDGMANLGFFGSLSSSGLSFRAFKTLVEQKVAAGYPNSNPSLIIYGNGIFPVKVDGEVTKSGFSQAWGLTRLSELVQAKKTPYSSIQTVTIEQASGAKRVCNLFKTERNGDISHDPFLRPGDKIYIARAERIVTIVGEVRRPGSYELAQGEELAAAIELYADGFTDKADRNALLLTRLAAEQGSGGEKRRFDFQSERGFQLKNYDTINIPSLQDLLPVAYFEGALGAQPNGQSPQVAQRIVYQYFNGESVGQAAKSIAPQFTALSDLRNAYILRMEARKPIDLEAILFMRDSSTDVALVPGDRIVIPFVNYFVSVIGGVRAPGRYPYTPDKRWDFYVNLAGGIDPEVNDKDALQVYDPAGKPKPSLSVISPEDRIVVEKNGFIYNLGSVGVVATLISTIATLIATLLAIASTLGIIK